MKEHDWTFRVAPDTPAKVKQEVSKTDKDDGQLKVVTGLSNVAEWPGTQPETRDKGKEGGDQSVKESTESTVPFWAPL